MVFSELTSRYNETRGEAVLLKCHDKLHVSILNFSGVALALAEDMPYTPWPYKILVYISVSR